MFRKICTVTIFSLLTISACLTAEIEYYIHDIGTLQTKESQAIAINNRSQILGWYNVDGSKEGKHFFVRDKNGTFHELQNTCNEINWRYLTDDGKAYGTFDGNANYAVLFMWDQCNGIANLGNLPGKEISAINNSGQVLLKSVVVNDCGRSLKRPAIWENGQITTLHGLGGDLGIESEESYGLDMNNQGEVVGQSLVSLSYKNEIYKQTHAVKWVNGEAIDLHKEVPKTDSSRAIAINDRGDVIINGYLIQEGGQSVPMRHSSDKAADMNYFYTKLYIIDRCNNEITSGYAASNKMYYDADSIWMSFKEIISVNNSGEVIGKATTIYGENHAILLSPVCKN